MERGMNSQLRQGSRISMSAPNGGRPKDEAGGREAGGGEAVGGRPDSSIHSETSALGGDGDGDGEGVHGSGNEEEGGAAAGATEGSQGEKQGEEEEEEEEDNEWGFTKKQLSDLEEAFNVFDVNRDGTVTPHKLFNVMRSLGLNPTEAEVQDLINAVDEDGNGSIEFDEFCEMMQKKINSQDRDDELKEAFRVFDSNENGSVSVEDMTSLFGALGMAFSEEEITEMVRVGDPTGQMKVDFTNFVRIAKSEPEPALD